MLSLPFKITNLFSDLAEAHGLVSIEGDYLRMEFQTQDAILGLLKSQLKEIKIPIQELNSAIYQKKLFGTKIILRANKLSTLSRVPGHQKGQVVLEISRKDRDQAEQLVSSLDMKITEMNLRRLDKELDDLEGRV
ncbi:hypothetical protein JW964_20565 [candidate division KSB1 bacterium]|nr:hypothetical protein [candidate division KSB1 bacterium]